MDVADVGLTEVYHPSGGVDVAADLVFVHGLGGHPRETWRWKPDGRLSPGKPPRGWRLSLSPTRASKKSADKSLSVSESSIVATTVGCFWPSELLPKDFPNLRILTYGYDSHVSHFCRQATNQMNISQHGRTFLSRLVGARSECTTRPLIFVAHSLGGLLVKDALIESRKYEDSRPQRSIFTACYGAMFFGTPHLGSGLASWGNLLSNVVEALGLGFSTYKGVLRSLSLDSEKLDNLARDFNDILNANIPQEDKIKIYSFQEAKGISSLAAFDGKVISISSSPVCLYADMTSGGT